MQVVHAVFTTTSLRFQSACLKINSGGEQKHSCILDFKSVFVFFPFLYKGTFLKNIASVFNDKIRYFKMIFAGLLRNVPLLLDIN